MKNAEKLLKDIESSVFDDEMVLINLDKIGQTIEIMDKVVKRLKNYVSAHAEQRRQVEPLAGNFNRTLH